MRGLFFITLLAVSTLGLAAPDAANAPPSAANSTTSPTTNEPSATTNSPTNETDSTTNASPAVGDSVVQSFTGTASQITPLFKVDDNWEIRWTCPGILNVTVFAEDGTVAAGAAVVHGGVIHLTKGGSYYLQVDRMGMPSSAPVNANAGWGHASAPVLITSMTNGMSTNAMNNLAPAQILSGVPWNIDIVQVRPGGPPVGLQPGVAYIAPASAPGPGTTNAPPGTAAGQPSAVVTIKGDNRSGLGFLVKMGDGPAVATNLSVLSDNPNLQITTSTGAVVKMLGLKGASDRDLALITIEDAGYTYLPVADEVDSLVQIGDEVVTSSQDPNGGVALDAVGNVLGVGPLRVEFDNPGYDGNSGGPVFHTKSGKVVGVVTEATKMDTSLAMDRASFQRSDPTVSGSRPYYGLRMDNIINWEPYDWKVFETETAFLDQFHLRSRCLDSYLNTLDGNSRRFRNGGFNYSALDPKLYVTDEKIKKAHDLFFEQIDGADSSQRMDAERGLLFELQGLADDNMADIQNMNNFYGYDRLRAKEEIDYRNALKAELEAISSDTNRLSHLARAR